MRLFKKKVQLPPKEPHQVMIRYATTPHGRVVGVQRIIEEITDPELYVEPGTQWSAWQVMNPPRKFDRV